VEIPGGNGQLVASPWIGALDYQAYLSEGSTAGSMRDTVALYNPGSDNAHVRVTLYRPDSARRVLQFTLQSGGRQILALNKVAPGTGFSTAVEADRRVVIERFGATQAGLIGDPGAARTARIWYFAGMPVGSPSVQQLVLFNPHEETVVAHVRVGFTSGACCAADLTLKVPPLRQYTYQLGAADTLRGPLAIFSSEVVAAERIATTTDQTRLVNVPGTVITASHWYLPEVHGGTGGAVTLFNPSNKATLATIRTALDEGSGPWLQRAVPAFSEVRVPLSVLTSADVVAAQVDSSSPILVGTEWYPVAGLPTATIGSATTAKSWAFIGGLAGRGMSETLAILNPSAVTSLVSVRVTGDKGGGTYWTVTMPAHSKYSRTLDNLVPSGGATVRVEGAQPITVEHRFSDRDGATTSPGAILSGS
jgi:hypothetical protein